MSGLLTICLGPVVIWEGRVELVTGDDLVFSGPRSALTLHVKKRNITERGKPNNGEICKHDIAVGSWQSDETPRD